MPVGIATIILEIILAARNNGDWFIAIVSAVAVLIAATASTLNQRSVRRDRQPISECREQISKA